MSEKRSLLSFSTDPFILFNKWYQEAHQKEINDPNAMNLSTISEDHRPTSRIVLLKNFNERGFVFYTNTKSKKGISIKSNPNVALNFYWKSLAKQVRIEGVASKVSDQEANEYFESRSEESKIGAWSSSQSCELENRKILDNNIKIYNEKFINKTIPRPPHWSGFRVEPNLIEFWQFMPFRLHDRLEFKKVNNKWIGRKLFP